MFGWLKRREPVTHPECAEDDDLSWDLRHIEGRPDQADSYNAGRGPLAETPEAKRLKSVLDLFDGAIGFVHANPFEVRALASNILADQELGLARTWNYVDWLAPTAGTWVGHLPDQCFVQFRSAIVDGEKVVFFHSKSPVVDYEAIETFIRNHAPLSAKGSRNRARVIDDPFAFDEVFI